MPRRVNSATTNLPVWPVAPYTATVTPSFMVVFAPGLITLQTCLFYNTDL
jgi:hypothetical protein